MRNQMLELQIAAAPVIARIPRDKSLEERLQFAMRYVHEHGRELCFMSGDITDELLFRVALVAVLTDATGEEREQVQRSLAPLQALSAAFAGVPVDLEALDIPNDLMPLLRWFDEAKQAVAAKQKPAVDENLKKEK
jgi:hypothetical protein